MQVDFLLEYLLCFWVFIVSKNTFALFGTVFRIRNSFSRVPDPDLESHTSADPDPKHHTYIILHTGKLPNYSMSIPFFYVQ